VAEWVLFMLAGIVSLFAYGMLRTSPASAPVATPTVVPPPVTPALPDAGAEDPDAGAAGTNGGGEIAIESPDGGAPSIRFTAVDDGAGPLPVPRMPRIWGDKGAIVTIVWFGDLECPHTTRIA
jgi:hypothetical protein